MSAGTNSPDNAAKPDFRAMIARVLEDEARIRADLLAAGIHVGWGDPPRCLVCEEAWPCQ